MVTSYIYLKTTYTCYGYKKNNKLLIQFQLAKAGNLSCENAKPIMSGLPYVYFTLFFGMTNLP